jgi:hypothetical protein
MWVPDVTWEDVERLVKRDYHGEDEVRAFKIIKAIKSSDPRTPISVIKLAKENIELLPYYVQIANQDWRDVLSMAEYPRYTLLEWGNFKEEKSFIRMADEADRREYYEWLIGQNLKKRTDSRKGIFINFDHMRAKKKFPINFD